MPKMHYIRSTQKNVSYAYPSSPYAEENGFGKTGVWYVEHATIKHFATKEEALAYAESLPQKYHRYSFKP